MKICWMCCVDLGVSVPWIRDLKIPGISLPAWVLLFAQGGGGGLKMVFLMCCGVLNEDA